MRKEFGAYFDPGKRASVLTMKEVIDAAEESFRDLG